MHKKRLKVGFVPVLQKKRLKVGFVPVLSRLSSVNKRFITQLKIGLEKNATITNWKKARSFDWKPT